MTCAEFQNRLSAYIDGELPRWKRWKVQNHLERCPECAALMQDLEEVDIHMAVGLNAPAPEYLTSAVMHRLPAMPPPWRRTSARVAWSAGFAVAAMQLLALCGAYWWGYTEGTDTSPATNQGSMIAPPIHPRKSESHRKETRTAAPANSGGIWSQPIGTADPETLRRLQQEPPAPKPTPKRASKKRAQTRQLFGPYLPQLQLEGAR